MAPHLDCVQRLRAVPCDAIALDNTAGAMHLRRTILLGLLCIKLHSSHASSAAEETELKHCTPTLKRGASTLKFSNKHTGELLALHLFRTTAFPKRQTFPQVSDRRMCTSPPACKRLHVHHWCCSFMAGRTHARIWAAAAQIHNADFASSLKRGASSSLQCVESTDHLTQGTAAPLLAQQTPPAMMLLLPVALSASLFLMPAWTPPVCPL